MGRHSTYANSDYNDYDRSNSTQEQVNQSWEIDFIKSHGNR